MRYLIPFIFNILVFILIVIFSIFCFTDPRLFEDNILNGISNTFCQNSSNYELSICNNKYKKKKFILLLLDGLAFDSLEFFSNPEKYNLTKVYKNYDPGYKITGRNFESMFTGKDSRNYKYKPFNSDNFFRQLHNVGFNLSYLGHIDPIFKFLNKEKTIELNTYKIEETETISLRNLCNESYNINDEWVKTYLKKNSNNIGILKISREEVYNTLNGYFKNSNFSKLNISECLEKKFDISKGGDKFGIIYYSTVLDHYNHKYTKKHYKTILQAYSIDSYLYKIYEFIQKNNEYALIIASDHGGNIFLGNDEIISHGSNVDGNEGILFIYTKELGFEFNKLNESKTEIINMFHYASTMPLIIEGINIPIEAIGVPLLFYNNSFWEDNVIKMKTFQIVEYFQKVSNIIPDLKKKFHKYISETFLITREKISFEEKKKKLLNLHLKGIKIVKRKLIPFSCYFYIFIITIFFIGKIFIDILSMKNILKEKDKTFNKRLFYLMINGLFFPIIILFFPSIFELQNRINFIILSSSLNMLIPTIKTIKNVEIFAIIILLCNLFAIYAFKIELYYQFKYFLQGFYIRKLAVIIAFLIIFIYIYFYLKKNLYNKYFDSHKKIHMYYFSLIFCMIIAFLIFIFHLFKPYYNEGKKYVILNYLIYILLILLFFISTIYPKDEKGSKIKKFVLTKLFTILFQIYIIEVDEILIILIFFIPLLEFLSYIYEKSKKKSKVFLWQFHLIFLEIFYLLIKRTFDRKSYQYISLHEINKKEKKMDPILNVLFEANYPLILYSYLFQFTYFPEHKKFINSKSMLMRYITYIRGNIILLCFLYNIFIRKVESDFIVLMYYTGIYALFVIFDGLYIFSFYICEKLNFCKIIINHYFGYHHIELHNFNEDKNTVVHV